MFPLQSYDTSDTHGTGCTLSSAIASAMAIGHQQRSLSDHNAATGAGQAIQMIDACCLAKAYVTAGIEQGKQVMPNTCQTFSFFPQCT